MPGGRIKAKKQIGRPRCKTLDWMMNRGDGYTILYIPKPKRDGTVSKNMERLVPRTRN